MTFPSTLSPSVRYGLHFVGVWPGTPLPGLRKFCWVIAMGLLQTYQYRYIIQHYYTDSLLELIDNLSITMPFSLVCIKLIVAWTNQDLLRDILSTMDEDCQKYAAIDTNNLISKTARISLYFTTIVMSAYVFSSIFYLTEILTMHVGDNSTRRLLFQMDLPFETNESPAYELVVSVQILHLLTSGFTFGLFNAVLLMVVLHLDCHINVMCKVILDDPLKNKEQINFFINRHKEIILFADRIEKLFTYITLSQLTSNTLITCCLGYLIVMSVHTENRLFLLIRSVFFYVVICLEIFIYCFSGEYLNTKSKLIGDTIYEIDWYDLHPSERRLLVLLILRSQKGFMFTCGKFTTLSLESFTSFIVDRCSSTLIVQESATGDSSDTSESKTEDGSCLI
ncbi:odorant receptor 67c-like [Osmia lignaria lignaria]|uniref:odorant receptor 67c-like n=1 Tax=Osmia lignaria lignaria TaxID=1437193 RepID=UPI00402B6388